ncbi:uncharacterized protein LOC126722110 [Quercus robur]|uniref:uncharacterized protein LOC126722110 n=1 Tax=Quercus robur TaxID=38942 RepID=UPI002162B71F|nr:uncharacterized protein LOC126722110 [Quercus robur]
MASMTNVLQKQHHSLVTAQDMMLHLKEMFGEQSRSARQTAIKNLMSTKMVEGTPFREHVLKMISFINELDICLVQKLIFIMNYNMNKMVVTLLELLNMLKAAKDLIKKEKPTVMLAEKIDTSLKLKPKGKNFKRKGSQSFNKAQGDKVNKDTEKKKAKGNCFHCSKLGHWKRKCRHYLASLKNDKPAEVSIVSRYQSNPGSKHWTEVKHIFKYLNRTKHYFLVFGGEDLTVQGYTDSDFQSDIDDRKSISGFVFTLGNGAISWRSCKQDTTADSTTEARYIAASEAAKEAV